jgi:hypothetical protein
VIDFTVLSLFGFRIESWLLALVLTYILVVASIWSYYFSKKDDSKSNLAKEFKLKRFNLINEFIGWLFIIFFIILFIYLFLLDFFNMVYQNFDAYIKIGVTIAVFFIFTILIFIYFIMHNREKRNQLLYQTVPLVMLVTVFAMQGFLTKVWMGALLIVSIVILLTIMLFTESLIDNHFWKKPNWNLLYMFLVMVLLLFIGTDMLNNVYGDKPLELKLFYENNQSLYGNITCNNPNIGKVYIGSKAVCDVRPKLCITKSQVLVISHLGIAQMLNNTINCANSTIEFTAPSDNYYISFDISSDNKNVTVGNPHEFYDYKTSSERHEKLITYFLALLGAILFSIPSLIANIIKIRKEDKSK